MPPIAESPWPSDVLFHGAATVIELIGAMLIVGYVAGAVAKLVRTGLVAHAWLLVAEGAVMGLTFKTAGAMLKVLELRTWSQVENVAMHRW